MIETDYLSIYNFSNAIYGMRNPLESWTQSDSLFGIEDVDELNLRLIETRNKWMAYNGYGNLEDCEENLDSIHWMEEASRIDDWLWNSSLLEKDGPYEVRYYFGPKDLKLAQSLIRAGADESKFMRQIFINIDITAPLYWWKEMDTYKVGTTSNSTSTMHKLTSDPIIFDDFSFDQENSELSIDITQDGEYQYNVLDVTKDILAGCEGLRQKFVETGDKRYWRALIQLLPESYNQTRTWTANYAVLRNIYFARRNHKLQEWRDFCKWIETLPYAKELICLEEKKDK